MVIIDDIWVRVAHSPMTMRMAVGFRFFPTFVIVMEIVGVFVLVEYLHVGVHQNP